MTFVDQPMVRAGDRIAGTYEVLHPLGRGGMAQVWAARHIRLGHKVAIKVPAGAAKRERFIKEARLAASISHRHIVRVLDVADAHQAPFMAMELVEGKTLEDHLDALSDEESVAIVTQLLSALEACHDAGVIHRDLKPENVFVECDPDDGPHVTLVDFGISKVMSEGRRVLPTRDGAIVGTPEYMPPEQARGKALDHRVDLYAAGVLLYELLGGQLPFTGATSIQVLAAVLDGNPTPLRELRPDLPEIAAIVECAMSPHPNLRYADARQMRFALMEAAGLDLGLIRGSITGRFMIEPHPARGAADSRPPEDDVETQEFDAVQLSDPPRRLVSHRLVPIALAGLVLLSVPLLLMGGTATASTPGPKVLQVRTAQLEPETLDLDESSEPEVVENSAIVEATATPRRRAEPERRPPTAEPPTAEPPTAEPPVEPSTQPSRPSGLVRELDF